jgi:hypothetical protein
MRSAFPVFLNPVTRHLSLATRHTLAQNFPMSFGFHATFARVKELVAVFMPAITLTP